MFQSQRQVINNKICHAMVLEDFVCRDNVGVMGLLEYLQPYICFFLGECTDSNHLRRVLFMDGN